MKNHPQNSSSKEIQRGCLYLLFALLPAFMMSMLSLLFVMFEIRLGSYGEALLQTFILGSLGVNLWRFYRIYMNKYSPERAKVIMTKAAFLILFIQCYIGFYGLVHLFEDQCIQDEIFWGVQLYGFSIVGGMIWVIRKLTVLTEV